MYAVDFEYDSLYLSDFGFMVCDFNGSSGANVADAGSVITFNIVARNKGANYSLTSTQYDECLTATFDICKDPEEYDDLQITNDEWRDIIRWLNRKEFLPFRVIDEDNESDTCYYDASFNVSKITIGERLYGIELAMTTNRPFGYGQEQTITWNMDDPTKQYLMSDISDEIGYIYPDCTITCNKAGDLQIVNVEADTTTLIKNVTVGEVITLQGEIMQISTSLTSHDIWNDFNFEFPKICNSYTNRLNHFTASIACELTMTYTPIIKDTV